MLAPNPTTLVATAANPIPDGVAVGELRARDGTVLRYARWQPPPGRKGTVCLFPGRAEFIEKYFEVVAELQQRGFAVVTLDWRGQGRSQRALSDPRKGYVRSFAQYDNDLDTLMREVVLPDCPPPYFALAHSMGGAIILRAVAHGRRWFERVVLSAPMIALPGRLMSPAARATTKVMRFAGLGGSYVPGGGATSVTSLPFAGNELTSDPVRYARTGAIVETEPSLALGSPTIAWLDSAYNTMAAFAHESFPRRLRQPMLIVAAGQDTVVSTPAIEQFAIRLRAGAHVIVAGARHEVMMERDHYRGQFWAAFDAFIPGTPTF